jgi:3-oxoacyl-[acyl-carrier protein] reductase
MDFGLTHRTVLVTGGNRGIGLAIALAFAEEGAHVAICGRDQIALESATTAITEYGVRAKSIASDLFTAEGCEQAVTATVDSLGALDVLVNNASTSVSGSLEDQNDDRLMERVMGKTLASMRCARAALPHLRASGRGRIICIGGTSARAPGKGTLPSGLSNSALANFAKQLSTDVAPDGITVNVVHPSTTKTERHRQNRFAARARERGISLEEAEASFAAGFPIGRMVEPADIAPLVLFLASEQASAITGQAIAVDGGATPSVVY